MSERSNKQQACGACDEASRPATEGVATFFVEVLGCQMNRLDGNLLEGSLSAGGAVRVDRVEDADLAVLVTCSVREHAEDKALSRVGHWNYLRRTTNRPKLIAMVGCFAQRDPQLIMRVAPFVNIVCGPGRIHQLQSLIASALASPKQPQIATDDYLAIRQGVVGSDAEESHLDAFDAYRPIHASPFQEFVRIQRGCDNFCTYCIVPYVRGPERSRPMSAILDEVLKLDDAGCKEVTLVGQTVSAYHGSDGAGGAMGLAELLRRIHARVSIPRIRFITSYPGGFDVDILHAMAELDRVCPYLHLPAQHGSNAQLRAMNRKYTIEQYVELIETARRIVPEISLAGECIVGFPGETDADHGETLRLLDFARYKNCFTFKYSPRPGTAAERRLADDIPDAVKTRRLQELQTRQGQIAADDNALLIGRTVRVLVEGRSKKSGDGQHENQLMGRTVDDRIAVFSGDASLIGQIVEVCVERITGLTLFASTR